MKKALFFLILPIFIFGCRGPKGDQGSTGTSYSSGYFTITNSVNSDHITITDSRITPLKNISVYAKNTLGWMVLPTHDNTNNFNVTYVVNYGGIELYNLQLGGFTNYQIVVEGANNSISALPFGGRLLD